MAVELSPAQEAFLEECALEFSDRFTGADLEYKKIFDLEIPVPPIMCPWYSKSRFNRDRFNDRRDYNDRRDHRDHRDRNYQDERSRDKRNSYNRDQDHSRNNYSGDRNSHQDFRYRPY